MKRLTILMLLVLLGAVPLQAQNYKTGIGLRGGYVYGLTIKHFVNPTSAVEGIISPRWNGILVTGLYEKHTTAFQVKQLQFYGGGGAHIGFWDYHNHRHGNHPWFHDDDFDNENHTVVGADLVLGLEYSFKEIPFAVGIDWKPGLNLIGHQGVWLGDVALNLRLLISNM